MSGFGGFDTYEEWQRDQRNRYRQKMLDEAAARATAEENRVLEELWQKLLVSGHDEAIRLLREFGDERYEDGLVDEPESNDGYPI